MPCRIAKATRDRHADTCPGGQPSTTLSSNTSSFLGNRYHMVPDFFKIRNTSSPFAGRLTPGLGLVSSIPGNRIAPVRRFAFRLIGSFVISTSTSTSNLVKIAATAYATPRLARKRPGHSVFPPPKGRYDFEDCSLGCSAKRSACRRRGSAPQTEGSRCS